MKPIKAWAILQHREEPDGRVYKKLWRGNGMIYIGTQLQAKEQVTREYMPPRCRPVRVTITVEE
jgi:hypothetical protein